MRNDIYTTITKREIDTSIIDVNNIDISVDIKTGNNAKSNWWLDDNTTNDGILMIGNDTTSGGNLYIWITHVGQIAFGDNSVVGYMGSPFTVEPNTEYKIRVKYDHVRLTGVALSMNTLSERLCPVKRSRRPSLSKS